LIFPLQDTPGVCDEQPSARNAFYCMDNYREENTRGIWSQKVEMSFIGNSLVRWSVPGRPLDSI